MINIDLHNTCRTPLGALRYIRIRGIVPDQTGSTAAGGDLLKGALAMIDAMDTNSGLRPGCLVCDYALPRIVFASRAELTLDCRQCGARLSIVYDGKSEG